MVFLPNDEPTLTDRLDRVALVQRVADAVASCNPPQVLGIHGDWGVGKTSFLHQLHWDLVGECPQQPEAKEKGASFPGLGKGRRHQKTVTVVWFEAWRYQNEQAPIVALLQEIRTQLPWYSKALRASKKLSDVTIRGALLSLEDLTKRIGFQASKIEQAGRDWEDANLATRLPSHMIRQHLEDALKTLLGNPKTADRRLVVLIDDLDRCESETAYQLLEGIKIYLNLPNCVFVLGMNQEIIEGAVAQHLPKEGADSGQGDPQKRMAKRYLEKLCQNIWHLPLVENPDRLLLEYLQGSEIPRVLVEVVETDDCLPPVARKIKGYANLLLRFENEILASRPNVDAGEEMIRWARLTVAYTYLYHFHHRLYRLLWKDGRDFWERLVEWCRLPENDREDFEINLSHLQRRMETAAPTSKAGDLDARAAVPSDASWTQRFHDPATDEILHIESLIRRIDTITEAEADRHLLRQVTR